MVFIKNTTVMLKCKLTMPRPRHISLSLCIMSTAADSCQHYGHWQLMPQRH